ncbi:site-specific integrase [Streptomyces sp. NBC_01285]|uniref:tyrosine-type recombinase/integrase n=1 Tax=Streptomyces sp. NBC_01285 TaxID=2903813 RepID=UPI00225C3EF1|nr:site-specific integrase [Streptomyces sp. NBC_01285]MCX4771168.1 site-specific integrase [Streptomyces sp. NBC_01285]
MLTFDVVIWSIRQRKGRPKPWELRWRVGDEGHSKSYMLKPQADGRRSQLMAALQKGQQFDEETGLPEKELAALTMPTWYEHAKAYAVMKWPGAAAKHRASIAESLAVVTPVFTKTTSTRPEARVLRAALYQWAFRAVDGPNDQPVSRSDAEEPPDDLREALDWVAKHSMRVDEAAKPENVRAALAALSKLLSGKAAAENTANRKRMVLSNAFRYAVEERALLTRHPFLSVDWAAPQTSDEVDFRWVPGPRLAQTLLAAVVAQGKRGEHLEAFFGAIYYVATRPGEAVALRRSDFILPPESEPEAWGEVLVSESHPEVGSGWTDSGKSHDERGLKHRARKAVRAVPVPPVYVRMVRSHIARFGVAPDGRLFRAARGGRLTSNEYSEVWNEARKAVLSKQEQGTRLADVPYALRHAAISLWIKSGMDPVEAAYRAGHSLAVLYRFYAKLLKGGSAAANLLVEQGLRAEE